MFDEGTATVDFDFDVSRAVDAAPSDFESPSNSPERVGGYQKAAKMLF